MNKNKRTAEKQQQMNKKAAGEEVAPGIFKQGKTHHLHAHEKLPAPQKEGLTTVKLFKKDGGWLRQPRVLKKLAPELNTELHEQLVAENPDVYAVKRFTPGGAREVPTKKTYQEWQDPVTKKKYSKAEHPLGKERPTAMEPFPE